MRRVFGYEYTFRVHCVSIAGMATRPKTSVAKTQALSTKAGPSSSITPKAVAARTTPQSADDFDISFLQYLDGQRNSKDFVDPLSDDGLRLQALYVQTFSQHPMDVLRRIMENFAADPKDRISAAKTLLEYSQRKPTQSLAVKAEGVGLKLDAAMLSGLDDKELELLEKLLSKAQGGVV